MLQHTMSYGKTVTRRPKSEFDLAFVESAGASEDVDFKASLALPLTRTLKRGTSMSLEDVMDDFVMLEVCLIMYDICVWDA